MSDTASTSEDLTRENTILSALKDRFRGNLLEAVIRRKNRIQITTNLKSQVEVLSYLKNEHNFEHLSNISGVDRIDHLEAVYHLDSWNDGIIIAVKVIIEDNENPSVQSVYDLWKSADWHEREIFDLFGIHVDGHPNLKRLLLPEDWDDYPHVDLAALHPLRKRYKLPEKPFKYIPKEGEVPGKISEESAKKLPE